MCGRDPPLTETQFSVLKVEMSNYFDHVQVKFLGKKRTKKSAGCGLKTCEHVLVFSSFL